MVYAEKTTVDASKSRADIEATVARYGADSFIYGWEAGRAMVAFTMRDRQIRFLLPMPDRDAAEFTRTPAQNKPRSPSAAAGLFEQAVRSRYRSLLLIVKAKLEAVESEIVTFEQEFGLHMVMPDGRTAAEHVTPVIDKAYELGTMTPMLALGQRED